MKLEEAIKVNTALAKELDIPQRAKEREAVQLGIEALDFFIEFQKVTGSHQDARLPSETKE